MTFVKTTSKNQLPLRREYNVHNALTNYYLLVMFAVFPLIFSDAYFNIRHDKYFFFLIATLLVLAFEGVNLLSMQSENTKSKPKDEKEKIPLYKKFSFTDYAVLAFLAVCVISSIFSDSFSSAFFGTQGRNNGLLLMCAYAGIYFVISRHFYFKEYILLALAAGTFITSLLAVLNYFYIDPLGMFSRLSDVQTIDNFTSTIGNKNLMSSLLCIFMPVTITSFVHTKKNINRIVYLVSSCIACMAMMISDSDSGLLGFGVITVVMFIWYIRKIDRLKKFFLAYTLMFASLKLLILLSTIFVDGNKGMSELQSFLVDSGISYILIAFLAVVTALLYFVDHKKSGIVLPRAVQIVFIVIALLCVAGFLAAVIYFSCFDKETDLGFLKSFLRFNDSWGTHRGFMWIRSLWIFNDFSFYEKLFGCGPDMFYSAFYPYFSDLTRYGDSSTDCAHNEYLNYLVTTGALGLVSYLGIVVSSIRNAVKNFAKNPFAIVCASAVICYAVQAVVNIAQPITTPLFILFLALTQAIYREAKSGEIITFS